MEQLWECFQGLTEKEQVTYVSILGYGFMTSVAAAFVMGHESSDKNHRQKGKDRSYNPLVKGKL